MSSSSSRGAIAAFSEKFSRITVPIESEFGQSVFNILRKTNETEFNKSQVKHL